MCRLLVELCGCAGVRGGGGSEGGGVRGHAAVRQPWSLHLRVTDNRPITVPLQCSDTGTCQE